MPRWIDINNEIIQKIENYKLKNYMTDKDIAKKIWINVSTFTKMRKNKTLSLWTLKKLKDHWIIE